VRIKLSPSCFSAVHKELWPKCHPQQAAAPCSAPALQFVMRHVLMNFDHCDYGWRVHFIEADCRTLIGPKTRFYRIATLDGLRALVIRCNIGDLANFEHSVRAWGRGSNHLSLSDDQYNKLKRG
jgi:hypothetical protein